jgi:rhomboid protease GluP
VNGRSVTRVLVGINVLFFAAMTLTGVSPLSPGPQDLLRWGANLGALSLGPQPWRLLLSNYLHAGIIHIGFNMWCLWNLGFLAERMFRPRTYVIVYTLCGLGGSVASAWFHPGVVGVGASGAIFGLAGALIAVLTRGHFNVPPEAVRATRRSLLSFAGYNLLFGAIVPGIDNMAHVGGLVTGLALGAYFARR